MEHQGSRQGRGGLLAGHRVAQPGRDFRRWADAGNRDKNETPIYRLLSLAASTLLTFYHYCLCFMLQVPLQDLVSVESTASRLEFCWLFMVRG